MKWLWTPLAIQCHILGLGGIVIFAGAVITGDQARPMHELKWALFAFCLAYPALLILLWYMQHADLRDLEKPPTQLLEERQRSRAIMHAFLYLVAIFCVVIGRLGWSMDGISATYVGVLLGMFALLGHCGINIWWGGPLDPRNDPVDNQSPGALD